MMGGKRLITQSQICSLAANTVIPPTSISSLFSYVNIIISTIHKVHKDCAETSRSSAWWAVHVLALGAEGSNPVKFLEDPMLAGSINSHARQIGFQIPNISRVLSRCQCQWAGQWSFDPIPQNLGLKPQTWCPNGKCELNFQHYEPDVWLMWLPL